MIPAHIANGLIKNSDGIVHNHRRDYDTQDIIKLMLWGDKRVKEDTTEFAKLISPTKAGMKNLFYFLVENIRYKKDPPKAQWVKSPAKLWSDKAGDCKSFTLFITSVLQNIGVPYIMRFVSYSRINKTPKHVYPVAIIKGKEVPIDPVYFLQEGGQFGTEKIFYHKKDHKMKPGLSFISGTIGTAEETEQLLDVIVDIEKNIPDSILKDDVTQMTEGQLQRRLMGERLEIVAKQQLNPVAANKFKFAAQLVRTGDINRISAIGDTKTQNTVLEFIRKTQNLQAPAFDAPVLRIKLPNSAAINGFLNKVGDFFKRIGKGAVDGVKKAGQAVGNAFKKAWQKLSNWIFKGALQKSGPFFLFAFIRSLTGNKEVDRRREKQRGVLRFFEKLGMKKSNIEAAVKNGVIENMGATPDKIVNDAVQNNIAAPGISSVAAAVFTAVGWVIKIVKKLIDLFKKDKSEDLEIGENDTSDLTTLQKIGQLAQGVDTAVKQIKSKVDPNENYGNTGVYHSPIYDNEISQNGNRVPAGSSGGGGGLAIAAGLAALLFFV